MSGVKLPSTCGDMVAGRRHNWDVGTGERQLDGGNVSVRVPRRDGISADLGKDVLPQGL